MPKHIEYRAFTVFYETITEELTAPAKVSPGSPTGTLSDTDLIEVTSLWDTGAVRTCITPRLKNKLNLRVLDTSTTITGVGGEVKADIAMVNIRLMCDAEIIDFPVHVVDFPGDMDLLIGMDITGMGDFAVCNADGKTSFSFVIPPFPDRINFADQADAANKHSKT